tara:strand:+ start:2259 stop:2675 length:417 start_codon:yes stop_codon:yes gene_type:complete
MFLLNNIKVHQDIQRTIGDVQYPAGWFSNPEARAKVGMTEVPDIPRPDNSLFTSVENPDGSWTATPRTADDIAAYQATKDTEQAKSVRASRDAKLAKTDWRYRRDQTTTPEWDAYCQALRDIPAQAGFPWTIDWPTNP